MTVTTALFSPSYSLTPSNSAPYSSASGTCQPTPSFVSYSNQRAMEYFFDSLRDVICDARADDIKVDTKAIGRVGELLNLLPVGFPFPEAAIRENGDVLLEWLADVDTSLAVSISGIGKLYYALYLKGEKVHGSMDFIGDTLAPTFVTAATSWWNIASRDLSRKA